ncbi:hypothetical protein ACWGR3_30525 [Streptomyces albidoflavus]
MTAKHRDPEYIRNARIVRAQVKRAWRLGEDVYCWRCRRLIHPGQLFDVGHIRPDDGNSLENLAPEHRLKSATCVGNRSAGGALGAALTNAKRDAVTRAPRRSSGLLNWRVAGSFFAWRFNPRLRLYTHPSPRTWRPA